MLNRILLVALFTFIVLTLTGCHPSAKQALIQETAIAFDDAILALRNCQFLKDNYPKQYNEIIPMSAETLINLHATQAMPKTCAVGDRELNMIIIFPTVWVKHSKGCYNDDRVMLLAHEFMHVIGLPLHKQYDTYDAYMKDDPIEKAMRQCFP